MAPMQVDIVFLSANNEFYSGSLFGGKVTVKLDKPMPITKIQVCLKGKGFFRWKVGNTTCITHAGYLQGLITNFESSGAPETSAGEHSFPFALKLPDGLPETYKDPRGYIRYKAKAVVTSAKNIGLLGKTCEKSSQFVVHARLPIPMQLTEPASVDLTKQVIFMSSCCPCWSDAGISARITMDKGGYLPGQTIAFRADVSNKTGKTFNKVTLILKKKIIYHCRPNMAKPRTWHELRATLNVGSEMDIQPGLRGHESTSWSESYTVPPGIPPTDLGGAGIINVAYYLQLDLSEHSGCCKGNKAWLKVPLMIGSFEPQTGMWADTSAMVITMQPRQLQ